MNFSLLVFVLSLSFASANSRAQEAEPSLPDVEMHCTLTAPHGDEMNLNCADESTPSPQKERVSPFSLVLQTGAYAGLVSPGINFRFAKRNELMLLGGYVPLKIDGSRLWQMNFKYQVEPFRDLHLNLGNGERISFNPIHVGAGVIYGMHRNLFVNLPSQYPAGYYRSTAFRYTFNVGTSVKFRRMTLYVDYSALDMGFVAYFWDKNGQFFRDHYPVYGLAGIGTLGFGLKYNLYKRSSHKTRGFTR